MVAAQVFARFVQQAKSPPSAAMVAAFDNCMDAASVVGRFKFMLGDVQAQILDVTREQARNGQPRTLSCFPPISDEEFGEAQDEAYAASVGGNTLPEDAQLALMRADRAVIEAWLDAGGAVDARVPHHLYIWDCGTPLARGGTMLIIASGAMGREVERHLGAEEGDWDGIRKALVEMLLRHGASVDLQDSAGMTALMMAARFD